MPWICIRDKKKVLSSSYYPKTKSFTFAYRSCRKVVGLRWLAAYCQVAQSRVHRVGRVIRQKGRFHVNLGLGI